MMPDSATQLYPYQAETACARLSTASFTKMVLMCDFTVSGTIPSSRAISLLDRPLADTLKNIALAGAQ
jgi:hypothetical protein